MKQLSETKDWIKEKPIKPWEWWCKKCGTQIYSTEDLYCGKCANAMLRERNN